MITIAKRTIVDYFTVSFTRNVLVHLSGARVSSSSSNVAYPLPVTYAACDFIFQGVYNKIKHLPNSWGPACDVERTYGRGGYCNLELRHGYASGKFGRLALERALATDYPASTAVQVDGRLLRCHRFASAWLFCLPPRFFSLDVYK